jgi:hypothetical protein
MGSTLRMPSLVHTGLESDDRTSKSQYEKYFKRWGFRKNLTKEEWTPIRQKVLARKRAGKESDVYLEGVLMPAKKVKRGIGRYQQTRCETNLTSHNHGKSVTGYSGSQAHVECTKASEHQTPNGVTIITPIPVGSSSNLFGDLLISQYFASLLYQQTVQSGEILGQGTLRVQSIWYLGRGNLPQLTRMPDQKPK